MTPTIGVFDSGFGGLTVLRALMERLPRARFAFLGDTARLPYGSKSRRTIARYAAESAQFLVREQGAEFLVIACNTASALALDAIEAAVPVPVLGVIEPGALAARAASKTGDVLVIATAATVESHAYAAACRAQGLRALEKACPLLVPLVEEGWTEHPVTVEVIGIYLAELLAEAAALGLKTHSMAGFDQEAARKAFEIPADYLLGAAIALGYQGEPSALGQDQLIAMETAPRERKPLSEIVLSAWGTAAKLG